MSTPFDTDILTRHGRTYRAEYFYDEDAGEPWKKCDGHGIVSDWVTREPAEGERVLTEDRTGRQRRLYDFDGTLALAIKDQWGVVGGRKKGETARAYAVRAVEHDWAYLCGWVNDEWHYAEVVVTLLDVEGKATRHEATVCGVETYEDYHRTGAVDELIGEIEAGLAREVETLAPRIDPDPNVNWKNDAIQFPRLLAELFAVVQFTPEQLIALSDATDLEQDQLVELFTRAQAAWEDIKARTK